MPRRPRNPTGFVRPRQTKNGKSWQGIVKYPDPDEPGKWRTRSATFARRAEAQAWLDKALAEHRADPAWRPPSEETLGEYLERWLEAQRARVRPTTLENYRHMTKHLSPLVAKPLASVTPADLQALYGSLLEAGKSPRTVALVHAVVRHALSDAVEWGLIPASPAAKAKPPRPTRREIAAPTPEEAARLLAATERHPLHALWAFLALTGCRKGEALALRWSDVDLDRGVAVIRRSLTGSGRRRVEGPTKTATGARTIALSPHLVSVLRQHRREQRLLRLAEGERWAGADHVFTTRRGTPLDPRYVLRSFKTALRAAALPETYRVHDLRHAMATLWLSQGIPAKVVSERLGHSSVSFTLQIYGHVLPGQQAQAAAEMDAIFLSGVTTASPREHGNGDSR